MHAHSACTHTHSHNSPSAMLTYALCVCVLWTCQTLSLNLYDDEEEECAKTPEMDTFMDSEEQLKITLLHRHPRVTPPPRPDSPMVCPVTPYAYPLQMSAIDESTSTSYQFDPVVPVERAWWRHNLHGMIRQSMDVITSMPQPSVGPTHRMPMDGEMPDGWYVELPPGTDHLQMNFQAFNWSVLYNQTQYHTGPLMIHDRSGVSHEQTQWRITFFANLTRQCPWPCVTGVKYMVGSASHALSIGNREDVDHSDASSFVFAFSPWSTIPEFRVSGDGRVLSMDIHGHVPVDEVVDELEFVILKVLYLLNSLQKSTSVPSSVTSIDLHCAYEARPIADMIHSKRHTLKYTHHVDNIHVFDGVSGDPTPTIICLD